MGRLAHQSLNLLNIIKAVSHFNLWYGCRYFDESVIPVKLRNRPFAHLFEVIGAMYALPKYGTIDLTRFFAPFYMIFFGFCMAEGGYGLVIMLGGLAAVMLGRKKGSSAMKEIGMLTMLCGFSGMVFGLMSGSFFGLQLSEWE